MEESPQPEVLSEIYGPNESPEMQAAECEVAAADCRCVGLPRTVKLGFVAIALLLATFNVALYASPGLSQQLGEMIPGQPRAEDRRHRSRSWLCL